jgi:hypothetical protein
MNDKGRFVIENYNNSKLFSNFLPGIAGIWGIPMWAFYINRGQCIASFGIESKDKAIMEFHPANKSYRYTALNGFRTMLKISSDVTPEYWEPFQSNIIGTDFEKSQQMSMSSHDLIIKEMNHTLGMDIEVQYFTLPEEPFSALVRKVTLTNNSVHAYDIEMLDGMPVIVPFGLNDWLNKHLGRTIEAWAKVRNLENKAPFYQLNVEVSDTPVVTYITEGNFFFGFEASNKELVEPIAEAQKIFGEISDFSYPANFIEGNLYLDHKQQTSNRSPSAMGYTHFEIKPGEEKEFYFVFGYANNIDYLNNLIHQVRSEGFMEMKAQRNRDLISEIKQFAFTNSSSPEFDLYAGNTFLDNILRGGLPISIKTSQGNMAFNVYSRKHGDLERDYNFFTVAPTYYSQGNGNYRDVNQNRRNDVWFNADVRDSHLVNFLNLVQADGYNPLVVKGVTFAADDEFKTNALLATYVDPADQSKIKSMMQKGFMPGDFLKFIERENIRLIGDAKEFLSKAIELCAKRESADHGEGFWTDHWTYNLDMIESYLAVYPENLKYLLTEKNDFFFYHNSHYVLPRDQKYVLTDRGVRQYKSVHDGKKSVAAEDNGSMLRTNNGKGSVYKTTLFCKLLCLAANKVATLDPSGIGIEMEADKPNWYDALNGLPGLLGSSISETFELRRLSLFLLEALKQINAQPKTKIMIYEELASFVLELIQTLAAESDPLQYWMKANDFKENYRQKIRHGITGIEMEMHMEEIRNFLELIVQRTGKAAEKAKNHDGYLSTYFYHEVTEYEELEKTSDKKQIKVLPLKFRRHDLPLFLEGYVHAVRVEKDIEKARALYREVKLSGLFDKKLKMYKVNAPLQGETEEIGRTRIFPSGWLENESIWLHMEYKLVLELLKHGLYEEFYENFRNVLVPFLDPNQYGRSILENSSFIVSSAHEDERLHGRGFVARLSGSTAEFLHIWLLMNAGPNPFKLNEQKELILQLQPILPGWMFSKEKAVLDYIDMQSIRHSVELGENTYACNFLGSTLLVYHNEKRKDTFGKDKAGVKEVRLMYPDKKKPEIISGAVVPSPFAEDIRNRKVSRIDVVLG